MAIKGDETIFAIRPVLNAEPVKKPTPPVDSTPTTPAAATARPTARPTVRPTVPTTPAPRPTVATPPTGFSCRVGRAQCRAAYVGKPWAFRKDATESGAHRGIFLWFPLIYFFLFGR